MNLQKKFIIFVIGFVLLTTAGIWLFQNHITKMVSDPDKIGSLLEKIGADNHNIGEQPGNWQSGAFTADGKYYVYTYGIQRINHYSQRDGSTFRSGPVKYYLQVIDASTGIPLLSKPIEMGDMATIMEIDNHQVWLSTRYYDRGFTNPELYIIGEKQLKFTAENFITLNPEIPLAQKDSRARFIENKTGQNGVVVEAADGRQYLINAQTGKFTNVKSSSGFLGGKDDKNLQSKAVSFGLDGYKAEGGTRKLIVKNGQRSIDDFIDPKFLILKKNESNEKSIPAIYNNHLFVLAPNTTANDQEMQLSMLDRNNLKTIWTLSLPQSKQEMDSYECERFALSGNQMRWANKTHFLIIDMDKGSITKTVSLYPEK